MGAAELKSNIHKIIDEIQNEQLLRTLYDFLEELNQNSTGQLWYSLTEEQKKEVILAYDESEDNDNLMERGLIFNN